MKTNVRETSVAIYKQIQALGIVGNQCAWIIAVMVPGQVYTNKELAQATKLDINAISGRVNELVNKHKMLEEGEKRQCTVTGNTVKTVRLAKSVELKEAA